ncbi:uncharacterized protein LOC135488280 [Lineus longissimus]|uniref:uncharacterized protein LOC135488280 n=1 Tax=Lineus longissimus TaxID=88925 RepID=UPI00315C4DAC
MGCITIIKALLTRILFAGHSFITIWRVVGLLDNPYYWGLSGGLLLLIIETFYTLIKRKGYDYKWVSPAFFFYLCSSVPGIWFLELDRLTRYQNEVSNFTPSTSAPRGGKTNGTEDTGNQNVGLASLNGATIPIEFSPDMWVLVIEQSLMFLLVIGRWLLPKGDITRDQLSQLLFVYIGLASDIMELFVLFDEKQVLLHPFLSYIILSIWTISLMQFVLVLTATKARRKKIALIRPTANEDGDGDDGECSGCCGGKCCENEVWSILITVLLQDAPFLSLRLYVMVTFNLFNYTILFFTVKNALVIVLQFYRLVVVTCLKEENVSDDDEESGSDGFDNKAFDDDGAELIDEKSWSRQPPPTGELKRRSPVGAAAGVSAGHDGTACGERFRQVDSPALSKASKQSSSLSSICSQPSFLGLTDSGTATVTAASVKAGQPNTPGSVRLVRVASARSNVVGPQATPAPEGGEKDHVDISGVAKASLPPIQTQPTPAKRNGRVGNQVEGKLELSPMQTQPLTLVKVQPTPNVPPRVKKHARSPPSSAKIQPSSTIISLTGDRGTTASPDIITGVSNTPPPIDTSSTKLKKTSALKPNAENDMRLLDYEDTALEIEEIEDIMNTIGADVAPQEPEVKATSGSDVVKSTGSGVVAEHDQSQACFIADVEQSETVGDGHEDVVDKELEELFETTKDGEENEIDSDGDVDVVEASASVVDDRKVQTVIELDADEGIVTKESDT